MAATRAAVRAALGGPLRHGDERALSALQHRPAAQPLVGGGGSRSFGENNYAFPPIGELPAVAQLLVARPAVSATVVVPHWPAQAWYQQLVEVSSYVELWPVREVARPPPWLHASAQHALSGMTLAFIRVEGRLAGA